MDTYAGILSVQTLAYAGFAILGVLLLVIIVWGLIHGSDMMNLGMFAVSGAIILILAYVIIYQVANAYIIVNNATIEDIDMGDMDMDGPELYTPEMMYMDAVEEMADAHISNLRLCYNEGLPCETTGPDTTIYVYWEVEDGIGCCNTFGCDYQLFTSFCGSPFTEYKLYDIALDGEIQEWGGLEEYDYECSNSTPWNYFYFENLSIGPHSITIWQKDCHEIIDTRTVLFTMIEEGGTYAIEQI